MTMISTSTPGSASFSELIKICRSPESFKLVLIVQIIAKKDFLRTQDQGLIG